MVFAGGVDTKTDPKALPPAKLLTLENGVLTSPGRIQKRTGHASMGTTTHSGTISAGAMLTALDDELLLHTGTDLFSYDSADSKWAPKANYQNNLMPSPCRITSQAIARSGYYAYGPDVATHSSGLQLYVWEQWTIAGGTSQGVYYSIIDSNTGQVLNTYSIHTNGAAPKALCLGSQWVILFISSLDNQLYGTSLAVTTPLSFFPAATKLTTGALNDAVLAGALGTLLGVYDACISLGTASGDMLYVVFRNNNGGMTTYSYVSGSLFTRAASRTSINAPTNVSVISEQSVKAPIVLYTTTVKTAFEAYNSALSSTLGSGNIEAGLATRPGPICGVSTSAASISVYVYWTMYASGTAYQNNTVRFGSLGPAYAIGAGASYARSVAVAGKPFVHSSSSTPYLPVSHSPGLATSTAQLQPTFFLLTGSSTNIVAARWAYGTASAPYYNSLAGYNNGGSCGHTLPETASIDASTFLSPCAVVVALATSGAQRFSQTGINGFSFAFDNTLNRAILADSLHFSGGVLQAYDGYTPKEHHFHLYPDPVTASTSAAGGSITAGTYQYAVTYEWTDGRGQVHRSTPSAAVSLTTTGATSTNTITIPTLRLTAKTVDSHSSILVQVYRTTNAGTIFYLLNTGGFTGTSGQIYNDITVDTVTCTDKTPDSSLIGASQLYTMGGVLPDAPAPPPGAMTAHRNRMFVVDSTNPLTVWYSKQVVPTLPVEFCASLTMQIDPRGGPVTALASLDDKLIVFKTGILFAVTGQGPDQTGAQNDFSDALFVSTDVGCSVPRSIVTTPLGIMFQSAKGIYLLGRDLSVTYIGAEVETYNSQTVTSAQLMVDRTQVRFTISSTILVYDYFVRQWSVFTNSAGVDATVWQNIYVFLESNGTANQELTVSYFDPGGIWIPTKLTTAWIQFAGLQGFQRVRRFHVLGDLVSAETLTVGVAYDFNPTIVQTTTIAVSSGMFQFRVDLQRQKCKAIQITLQDSANGGVSEGASWSGLTFEVGVKGGLDRLPASKTYG